MPSDRKLTWFWSPWSWVILAGVLRLAFLVALPLKERMFLDRAAPQATGTLRGGGVRAAFELLQHRTVYRPLTVDEGCYDQMAQNLLAGRGFVLDFTFVVTTPGQPSMYAGCAYPLFVAGLYALSGPGHQLLVFLCQILLQMAAVWWVHQTARRLAGAWAAAAAAGFFTFHPVLIWGALSLMTEAIIVPGTAALGWLLVDRGALANPRRPWLRPVVIGGLLAGLCLTRSTCFGFALIASAVLVWQARHRRPWSHKLRPLGLLWLVFCLVCAPWTVRNYIHWHRWIPFSTKSGVNAWFFNHPGLEVEFGRQAVEGPQPIDIFDPRIQGLPDEAARDARLMEMFKQFVREQPGKFLGLCWMRFWMALLPVRITSDTLTASISAWFAKGTVAAMLAVILALAVAGRLRWRRLLWRMAPLVFLVLYWQAIQSLAGPGLRYRLPVEPAWAVLAGTMTALLGVALLPRGRRWPLAKRWWRHR